MQTHTTHTTHTHTMRMLPTLTLSLLPLVYSAAIVDESLTSSWSIAASPSGGPLIEVMHVAGAGHQIPVDNPCGFADAVLASCNRGDEAHRKLFG